MTMENAKLRSILEGLEARLKDLSLKVDSSLVEETDGISADLGLLKQSINTATSKSLEPFDPKLVIFDKDGTLVCFHTMWTPWCRSLARKLVHTTGMAASASRLYRLLGFDAKSNKVNCGPLAEDTHPVIRAKIADMLHKEQMLAPNVADATVDAIWTDLVPGKHSIKTTTDLNKLFQTLKDNDVKIAICTSDSREGTMAFIKDQDIGHLVDMIVCGDDVDSRPKPNSHNAKLICQKLQISPAQTVMIGDTPADTRMGLHAQLGLNIGVLTGIGNAEDLQDADVLLQHAGQLDQLLINKDFHNAIVTQTGIDKMGQRAELVHCQDKEENWTLRTTEDRQG